MATSTMPSLFHAIPDEVRLQITEHAMVASPGHVGAGISNQNHFSPAVFDLRLFEGSRLRVAGDTLREAESRLRFHQGTLHELPSPESGS